jgi:hypothetical protein
MSFANEWLKYLKDQEDEYRKKLEREEENLSEGIIIKKVAIKGDKPKDMLFSQISIETEHPKYNKFIVKQDFFDALHKKEDAKIPDKISVGSIDVKIVEIEILGGFTFYVFKPKAKNEKPIMKIEYKSLFGRGFPSEKEETFIKEAKNRGYNVTEITTDQVDV